MSGPVTLEDAAGRPFGLSGRTSIGLCRCGHSENKPFCDGSHARAGFNSECRGARAAAAEAEALSLQALRIPSDVQTRNALRTAAGESGLPALRAARRSALPSGWPAARAVSRWNSPRDRSSR